mmetsp:Transcript_65902/g.97588  ORF Transcript_65902/g.97588 Transcript_65902/m.97588 type:complete len:83 (-) Transcript_65902:153-401(-)
MDRAGPGFTTIMFLRISMIKYCNNVQPEVLCIIYFPDWTTGTINCILEHFLLYGSGSIRNLSAGDWGMLHVKIERKNIDVLG